MECQFKFKDLAVWNLFSDSFACLPLAAVVNQSTFLVHGGVSPMFERVEEINQLNRFIDTFEDEAVQDMLWSDPEESIKAFGVSPRSRN
jgi:serine/threonine-protein phosphatase PP1 catalytic subunit